ncbi:MAG TPA: LemA family protein [Acidobacteriaceae bacterium]|jgi:LemA protein
MKRGGWIALGLVGVLILVALLAFGSYISSKNQMVTLDEQVNQAYSQVNVVQQRRLDLIPNLVASVKGYVKEEETVLTNIANARAGVLASASDKPSTSNIQANERLSAAIVPLFRLQEAYPDLKGNQQFMRLEDELAGTENRIAVERQRYNKTLQGYNTYVRQFPNSIWAGIAGFQPKGDQYFKGNPQNGTAPTVDFSK